jgi:hypothetical protein
VRPDVVEELAPSPNRQYALGAPLQLAPEVVVAIKRPGRSSPLAAHLSGDGRQRVLLLLVLLLLVLLLLLLLLLAVVVLASQNSCSARGKCYSTGPRCGAIAAARTCRGGDQRC